MTGGRGINNDTSPHYFGSILFGSLKNIGVHDVVVNITHLLLSHGSSNRARICLNVTKNIRQQFCNSLETVVEKRHRGGKIFPLSRSHQSLFQHQQLLTFSDVMFESSTAQRIVGGSE